MKFNVRTDIHTDIQTDRQTDHQTGIEKPLHGRPLLGPAKKLKDTHDAVLLQLGFCCNLCVFFQRPFFVRLKQWLYKHLICVATLDILLRTEKTN